MRGQSFLYPWRSINRRSLVHSTHRNAVVVLPSGWVEVRSRGTGCWASYRPERVQYCSFSETLGSFHFILLILLLFLNLAGYCCRFQCGKEQFLYRSLQKQRFVSVMLQITFIQKSNAQWNSLQWRKGRQINSSKESITTKSRDKHRFRPVTETLS